MDNTGIQPAARLRDVGEYYFSRKGKEVARLNAEGRDIISLAIGSPDMPPSPQTVETLCREARRDDAHGYQPTAGIPQLRQAMADFYRRWFGVELDPATEIQPLIGSKEGILHVTLALANAGDTVLVPNPGYPTYTSLSRLWAATWWATASCPKTGGSPTLTNWNASPTAARACCGATTRTCPPARRRGAKRTSGWWTSPAGTTSWW